MAEAIDPHLQQLRELQEDAIRLQGKAVIHAGQPEGEAINVVLHHLDQTMRKLEQYQVAPLLVRTAKSAGN
jgi:hypothetical protein